MFVVNCFQICIFTQAKTTKFLHLTCHHSCELLSDLYLYTS